MVTLSTVFPTIIHTVSVYAQNIKTSLKSKGLNEEKVVSLFHNVYGRYDLVDPYNNTVPRTCKMTTININISP